MARCRTNDDRMPFSFLTFRIVRGNSFSLRNLTVGLRIVAQQKTMNALFVDRLCFIYNCAWIVATLQIFGWASLACRHHPFVSATLKQLWTYVSPTKLVRKRWTRENASKRSFGLIRNVRKRASHRAMEPPWLAIWYSSRFIFQF